MNIFRKKKPLLRQFSYILSHYTEPISVKRLASEAGYTEVHFISLFRLYFGATPKQYITFLRLNKACRLLKTTKFSVCHIAHLCGYDDEFYFIRLFRKRQSLSPLAYRRSVEDRRLK